MTQSIIVKNVVLRYGAWNEPTRFDEDSELRYSATVLVPIGSEQDKQIRDALAEAAKEAYGNKAAQMLKSFGTNAQKICYSEYDDEHMKLSAYRYAHNVKTGKANPKPSVVGRDKQALTDPKELYLGCYVNLQVVLYAGTKHPGLRADFWGVQKVRDGEAFEAVASVPQFENLSDEEDLI